MVFQALNGRERDEWIASIHNIAKDGASSRALTRQCSRDRTSRVSYFNIVLKRIKNQEL